MVTSFKDSKFTERKLFSILGNYYKIVSVENQNEFSVYFKKHNSKKIKSNNMNNELKYGQ